MTEISYHLITGGQGDNVVAYNPNSDQPLYQADSRHPHWQAILDGLANGDENVFELFDVKGGMIKRLQALSDRVSYDGQNVRFDGDVQSGPLADHLIRCLEQGLADYAPIVKFWEKVAQNPDARSREQLFSWLKTHQFTISTEGDIVGYKGVVADTTHGFASSNHGTAFVNGVKHTGAIPNPIGAVVTMPRSEVANDPNSSCSAGLHVGDWSYASHFGDKNLTLEVHVNPRDVVSIPRDSNARKMRCCRYVVVQQIGKHYNGAAVKIGTEEHVWEGDVGYAPE